MSICKTISVQFPFVQTYSMHVIIYPIAHLHLSISMFCISSICIMHVII